MTVLRNWRFWEIHSMPSHHHVSTAIAKEKQNPVTDVFITKVNDFIIVCIKLCVMLSKALRKLTSRIILAIFFRFTCSMRDKWLYSFQCFVCWYSFLRNSNYVFYGSFHSISVVTWPGFLECRKHIYAIVGSCLCLWDFFCTFSKAWREPCGICL